MSVNFIQIIPNANLKNRGRCSGKYLYFKFEIRKCSTGSPCLYLLLFFNDKIQKTLNIKAGDYAGISYNEKDYKHICICKTNYLRGYKICKNKPVTFKSTRLQTTLRWKIDTPDSKIITIAKTYKVPFKVSKGKNVSLIVHLKNAILSEDTKNNPASS